MPDAVAVPLTEPTAALPADLVPAPIPSRQKYSAEHWARHSDFTARIDRLCADRGIDICWTGEEKYTAILRRGGAVSLITEHVFGLNPAATHRIMDDKADTFAALAAAGVPAIPHHRVRRHLVGASGERSVADLASEALAQVGLPMVIKPNGGVSGGAGVTFVDQIGDVASTLSKVLKKYDNAAVSPALRFDEYRTIVLDGEPLVTYRKIPPTGSRLHNLGKGAAAEICGPGPVRDQVQALAVSALAAVGGRVSSVDTVVTESGEHLVIELNSGIMVVHLVRLVPEGSAIADYVYGSILDAALPVS